MTLMEAEDDVASEHTLRALDWLEERQVLDEPGDWRESRPELEGGGWAFQYANPHYPDLDDTAVVALATRANRLPRICSPPRMPLSFLTKIRPK